MRGMRDVRSMRSMRGIRGMKRKEGYEGYKGYEGYDVAAIYIYCHMVRTPLGIGYMALWGFDSKSEVGWLGNGWMDKDPLDCYDY